MLEEAIFRIYRYRPEKDGAGGNDEFTIEVEEGMTILDGLNRIKWYQDGTLSYRKSCRSAICGSCAMNINGENGLACSTQIEKLNSSVIKVEPLSGFKMIKDLVVDMVDFF